MAEKKFTVELSVENIGPHYGEKKLSFSNDVDSNKAIFYATNGTGKSFVSRAFRLCTPSKANIVADEILTMGKPDGHFSFGIHSDSVHKQVDVSIARGKPPVVNDSSGLLFHVFNSDYVEENIKAKHYSPDGKIEGYILGKIQIDLSEEKRVASGIKDEIEKDSKAIDSAIDEAKSFLRQNGVTSNTTEYQAVTRRNAEMGFGYVVSDSVEECIRKIKTLENVPDNLSDIQFTLPQTDLSFLDQLEGILTTDYPKSEWDEEFVKEYKEHQHFIETGLDYEHADKKCPFCKREYDSEALNLINLYNRYRQDQEAQVVGQLQQFDQFARKIAIKIEEEEKKIDTAEAQLITVQKFFPSLATLKLERITRADVYMTAFQALSELISQKMENLSCPLENVEKSIESCKLVWAEINTLQAGNKRVVDSVNKTKNSVTSERLSLRKNLCKAKSIALQNELSGQFKQLKEKDERLKILKDEIENKEHQVRVSKRDKVYETFESFLNRFFNGKYQIDKDSFQIRFLGNTVGENASSILSDGEKGIVAFCWYLAETQTIVNNEEDYNKLFFIIDDPISSMDFHFVYAVAQSIRDIKSYFGITSHERIWIFTHNNEFFSIITRNNILTNAFMMKPGSIQKFNQNLLMPYENHLIDLVEIADGRKTPNHTTGNSIRHVLETIAKFENPKIGIEKFVRDEERLSKDSCIFSLCQDLSHGNIRMEPPYSEDVLKSAAQMVINFVRDRYPGQLTNI